MRIKSILFSILLGLLIIGLGISSSCNITSCDQLKNLSNNCNYLNIDKDLFCFQNDNEILINVNNVSELTINCNHHNINGKGIFLHFRYQNSKDLINLKKLTILNCRFSSFNKLIDLSKVDSLKINSSSFKNINSIIVGNNIDSVAFSNLSFINNQNVLNLNFGDNLVILNSKFNKNQIGIIVSKYNRVVLRNNSFSSNNKLSFSEINEFYLENNIFKNNKLSNIIQLSNSNGLIKNNLFKDNKISSIFNLNGKSINQIKLLSNSFKDNIGNIIIASTISLNIFNSSFYSNKNGICLNLNSINLNLTNNSFYYNDNNLVINNGQNNYISKNVFSNSLENEGSISINGISYSMIINNSVKNNEIRINNINFNKIFNNSFKFNKKHFILSNSLKNEIYNNIFNSSDVSFEINSGSKDNKIYNNLFIGLVKVNTKDYNIWNIDPINGTNIINGSIIAGNAYLNNKIQKTKVKGKTVEVRISYSKTCKVSKVDGICDDPLVFNDKNIDHYPLSFRNKEILNKTNVSKNVTKNKETNNSTEPYTIEIIGFKLNLVNIFIGLVLLAVVLFIILILVNKFKFKKKNEDLAIKDDTEVKKEYDKQNNNDENMDLDDF